MKTTLKTTITVKDICEGFVYNELEGRGCSVCPASSPFSRNISATISMPPTAGKERLPLLNQYSKVTRWG